MISVNVAEDQEESFVHLLNLTIMLVHVGDLSLVGRGHLSTFIGYLRRRRRS